MKGDKVGRRPPDPGPRHRWKRGGAGLTRIYSVASSLRKTRGRVKSPRPPMGGGLLGRSLRTMTNLNTWWKALDEQSRDRLMSDPYGPVPADVLTHEGTPTVVAAWWPSSQSGPDGFHFSGEVQDFIEARRLRKEYEDLEAEKRQILDRYFPSGKSGEPAVTGEGFRDKSIETRYYELERLIPEALQEYREFVVTHRVGGERAD